MTLKELRVWHWEQVTSNRRIALEHASQLSAPARYHNQVADFHLHCVQALNECLPSATTAEEDLFEQRFRHG